MENNCTGVVNMINKLLKIAQDRLASLNKITNGLPAPQVTVLLTSKGNIHVAINDIDGEICEELVQNQDTTVVEMITVWKDGEVDLSSHRFRVALVKMNVQNKETYVILQGENSLKTRTLGSTIANRQLFS